jgi:hypothetical protein
MRIVAVCVISGARRVSSWLTASHGVRALCRLASQMIPAFGFFGGGSSRAHIASKLIAPIG